MLNKSALKRQSGVSLIEILVTTLILGIGLLGVAALQISGVSSNLEGFYTSQATALAEELATRMRSSKVVTMIPTSNGRTNVPYGDYLDAYLLDANPIDCPIRPTNCQSNGGAPAVCDMQTLATFDLQDICWSAKQTLPDSTVRIVNEYDGVGTGDRLTIVVDWASTAAKRDLGEVSNVNASCVVITTNNDRNCILMELVP